MTVYDVAIVAVVIAGMVWGAWRGITWQLASIASLALGYLVAFPLSAELAPHFPGEPVVARGLALLASYVGISAAVFGVAWSVRATLRSWKFEAYDRHLGMILGGLEGALLGIVVTVFVVSFAPETRTPILTSRAGKVVSRVLEVAQPSLPREVREMLQPFWSGNAEDASPSELTILERATRELGRNDRRAGDGERLGDFFEQEGARAGRVIAEEIDERLEQAKTSNERIFKRR